MVKSEIFTAFRHGEYQYLSLCALPLFAEFILLPFQAILVLRMQCVIGRQVQVQINLIIRDSSSKNHFSKGIFIFSPNLS